MADKKQQIDILRQGSDAWNQWRQEHLSLAVELTGADLTGARLSEADLDGARGIRFDDNSIQGTRFTTRHHSRVDDKRNGRFAILRSPFTLPSTDDPWSLLRRRYTGAYLVLAWLALVAFLLPRMLTTVGLFLLGEYQAVAGDVVGLLSDPTLLSDPRVAEAVARYADEGRTYTMWQVILGIHRGGWGAYAWATLIVVLLVYNSGRFWLTLRVAALRDAETRSSVTRLATTCLTHSCPQPCQCERGAAFLL